MRAADIPLEGPLPRVVPKMACDICRRKDATAVHLLGDGLDGYPLSPEGPRWIVFACEKCDPGGYWIGLERFKPHRGKRHPGGDTWEGWHEHLSQKGWDNAVPTILERCRATVRARELAREIRKSA
jgi:hypothetical protein